MWAQAYGNQQHSEQLLACDAPPVIKILHNMKAPIFIYYELGNYFQNHRRRVEDPRALSCALPANHATRPCSSVTVHALCLEPSMCPVEAEVLERCVEPVGM